MLQTPPSIAKFIVRCRAMTQVISFLHNRIRFGLGRGRGQTPLGCGRHRLLHFGETMDSRTLNNRCWPNASCPSRTLPHLARHMGVTEHKGERRAVPIPGERSGRRSTIGLRWCPHFGVWPPGGDTRRAFALDNGRVALGQSILFA